MRSVCEGEGCEECVCELSIDDDTEVTAEAEGGEGCEECV